MLFCSSVATVGSAIATGSTDTARRSSARWAQATIAPASNAENNATKINCLAETLYILNPSFDYFALRFCTEIMLVETRRLIHPRMANLMSTRIPSISVEALEGIWERTGVGLPSPESWPERGCRFRLRSHPPMCAGPPRGDIPQNDVGFSHKRRREA